MIETEIIINEATTLKEVRRLTSYAGAKTADDEGAYERKSATSADNEMLKLWWREALTKLEDVLKPVITSISNDDSVTISLSLSSSWDERLAVPLNMCAGNYVVNYISGKWLDMTGEKKQGYSAQAVMLLDEVKSKIYYRKKPKRIAPVAKPATSPTSN